LWGEGRCWLRSKLVCVCQLITGGPRVPLNCDYSLVLASRHRSDNVVCLDPSSIIHTLLILVLSQSALQCSMYTIGCLISLLLNSTFQVERFDSDLFACAGGTYIVFMARQLIDTLRQDNFKLNHCLPAQFLLLLLLLFQRSLR
jgi:hypothetical protein